MVEEKSAETEFNACAPIKEPLTSGRVHRQNDQESGQRDHDGLDDRQKARKFLPSPGPLS